MLFGKTTQEAYKAEQKRLQSLYGKRHRKLSLWPVKLTDGRIAWLRWVASNAALSPYSRKCMCK